jgi:hypothetical protein
MHISVSALFLPSHPGMLHMDRNPTTSMTENPLAGISSEDPLSIKLRTTDNRIKQGA